MQITRGKIHGAQKVVIYGVEGIGKSTFAAQFPDPLFIDTEGSTNNMEVARLPKPASWSMLLDEIAYIKNETPCKTLVVDTIDWAERLCIDFVCARGKKDSITKFGYGEGFIQLEEEFGKFLNRLSDLIESGINVVLTAHAKIIKFEQPDEFGAYDRWELKLGNKTTAKTAALVKEWSDMLLFANYKTVSVATDDKGTKFKGQGKKRVMYTSHHPAWDAKNRHDLPEELPFNYAEIAYCIPGGSAPKEQASSPPAQEGPTYWHHQESCSVFEVAPGAPLDDTEGLDQLTREEYELWKAAYEKSKKDVEAQQAKEKKLKPNDKHKDVTPPGFIDITDVPEELAQLMAEHGVTKQEIQWAVANAGAKKYYPEDTPISNYDPQFIQGVLVGAWPQIFAAIKTHRENDDLPFN